MRSQGGVLLVMKQCLCFMGESVVITQTQLSSLLQAQECFQCVWCQLGTEFFTAVIALCGCDGQRGPTWQVKAVYYTQGLAASLGIGSQAVIAQVSL